MIVSPVIPERVRKGPGSSPFPFPLSRGRFRIYKRAMDLLVSTTLILGVLSWLLPVLAILIIADSKGPVFFVQRRKKRGQATFVCIKLRTMFVNEEAHTRVATAQDRRITAVGRWLRMTHLDELPQLFNVWIGDMSLVGPRPYMLKEDIQYSETLTGFERRNLVKPGITGLAQCRGYFGATSDQEELRRRLSLDNYYIQHWSLGQDVHILIKTFRYLWPE